MLVRNQVAFPRYNMSPRPVKPTVTIAFASEEINRRRPERSQRVLLVEDDEICRNTLALALKDFMPHVHPHLKIEVNTAANVHDAVALYTQAKREGKPYGLFLLDTDLEHGENSGDVIRQIQEQERHARSFPAECPFSPLLDVISIGGNEPPAGLSEEQVYRLPKPLNAASICNAVASCYATP